MHLVGFIIRIYQNAWSPECQILKCLFLVHVISSVIGCLCRMLKDTFKIFIYASVLIEVFGFYEGSVIS